MDAVLELIKVLKKKHYLVGNTEELRKEIVTENITLRKNTDLFIRDAITGLGTILVEDLEKHYYITTVRIGLFGGAITQAIIYRNENEAEIAVYAYEGLIRQNLAAKTMEKLKKVLI